MMENLVRATKEEEKERERIVVQQYDAMEVKIRYYVSERD